MQSVTILCGALATAGIFVFVKAKKYEFDNRTSGGVVKFDSYWKAQLHTVKKALALISIGVGGFMCLLSMYAK